MPNTTLNDQIKDPIHIISLGGGVQSSTMALMAAAGEITPMPVAAIFADTQAEPKSVYTWLDWLEKQLPFPVFRVGEKSLTREALRVRISRLSGNGYWKPSIPVFIKTDKVRMMGRHCTRDFKIVPLQKTIRHLARGAQSECWIGISVDEISRCKPSREKNVTNRWPLIDMGMTRDDCLKWMVNKGMPKPPRSACVYCPYHHDKEWKRLKSEEPEAFQEAIQFEAKLAETWHTRTSIKERGDSPYLHRSCVPLSEVDFSTEEERGQLNMFNNECEGMCGV